MPDVAAPREWRYDQSQEFTENQSVLDLVQPRKSGPQDVPESTNGTGPLCPSLPFKSRQVCVSGSLTAKSGRRCRNWARRRSRLRTSRPMGGGACL